MWDKTLSIIYNFDSELPNLSMSLDRTIRNCKEIIKNLELGKIR